MDRLNLETKHYAILAAFLVSLGAQLGGLAHGWHDATTPGFIGGLLGQLGTIIAAVLVGTPLTRDPTLKERSADRTQGAGV